MSFGDDGGDGGCDEKPDSKKGGSGGKYRGDDGN
jgi:hypothetical protein